MGCTAGIISVCRQGRRWAWNYLIRPAPRSPAPYGSHVPVLLVLSKLLKPRRVLELGCGVFSTPTFLDIECFPSLEHLVSIETSSEWVEAVSRIVGGDSRWQPQLLTGVAPLIGSLDGFDLIFVDDGRDTIERSKTLRTVLAARPTCPVAVHDAEAPRLRTALLLRGPYVIFDAFTPQTGLCNLGRVTGMRSRFERANVILRTFRNEALAVNNLMHWVALGRAAVEQLD